VHAPVEQRSIQSRNLLGSIGRAHPDGNSGGFAY
jgi:hypothetical protein